MKDKLKQLQLQILDKRLSKVRVCERPSKGWISVIRKALGMSVRQMGERMGITQQSAAQLEANERDGSITLKSLHKAAAALDCHVVYILLPNHKNLQDTVKKQAYMKAKDTVLAVHHTMELEAQGVGDVDKRIKEKGTELAQHPNHSLWD